MSYKINSELWSAVFAVPFILIDKYIKFCGAAQIKILLYILRYPDKNFDINSISFDLGLSPADVSDSLSFWINEGVIFDSDNTIKQNASSFHPPQNNFPFTTSSPINNISSDYSLQPDDNRNINKFNDDIKTSTEKILDNKNSSTDETLSSPKKVVKFSQPKPDSLEVSKKASESQEIAFLLSEAQNKFGRPISPSEASILVWLCDFAGVNAAVVLMVMEYAKSLDKFNMRYIQKVAVDWHDENIDSIEKAEQKINHLRKIKSSWTMLLNKLGLDYRSPTAKETAYIHDWFVTWNFPINSIMYAYNICADNTNKLSFSYMNKILKNWFDLNIISPADVKKYIEESAEKNNSNKNNSISPTNKKSANSGFVESSIDLNNFDDIINNSVPIYKKKEVK